MKLFRTFAVLLSVAALTACEKNAVQDLTGPLPSARIKFYNFGVNAPAVNFYANDRKMTAIGSTTCSVITDANREQCTTIGAESTLGIGYGGVASGDRYAAIDPGQYTFSGRIAAATDKDLPISTVPGAIGDGKNYSFYVSGFYDAASKSADGFLVEDNFPASIDYSVALVRFVNAISNANPMTLYALNTETGEEIAIGGVVAYKSAGAFTPVPNALYNLSTRYAGATTNAVVRTGVTFSTGRVYTIGARGDITVTSTTAATRPFLDNTTNR
jgi:hypothetical protein